MKPATTYIYGEDSGRIYWTGNDMFHSVYRYAIGAEEGKPFQAGDLSWIDSLDEDISTLSTRLGRVGFTFGKARRRIRNLLASKSYIRTSRDGSKHRISAYDWIMFIIGWLFVASGAVSLIAAFTLAPHPFDVLCGMYATAVASWMIRHI